MSSASLYSNLPDTPGVYLMKDGKGRILYIGKAGNLKRRVTSYFQKAHDYRIEKLVSEIKKIDHRKTDSALEALILESALIKKYQPPYNIREKDDKSFLYVEITKEKFPRVLLVRGRDALRARSAARVGKAPRVRGTELAEVFGPFTYASNLKEALRIIRLIFPWNTHPPEELERVQEGLPAGAPARRNFSEGGKRRRTCFNYEIGMCPGACTGNLDPKEYAKTVRYIRDFFRGKKQAILKSLEREMKAAAKKLEFERAAAIRGQVFALRHIRDTALVNKDEFSAGGGFAFGGGDFGATRRIEGYDISNISGTSAVGSMVVFVNGEPDRGEYRKFKIRTVHQSDDTAMLREIITRRFRRISPAPIRVPGTLIESLGTGGWAMPDLILIDGGRGQVNVARAVIAVNGYKIPVVGIAKGPKRKKNEFIGSVPKWTDEKTLIRVRDEAHRFAISYHRALRGIRSLR